MRSKATIFGIDPGYDRTGVALLSGDASAPTLLFSDCITTDKEESVPERIHAVATTIAELLDTHAPDLVAIEKVFWGRNTSTALHVAEVRGAIMHLARERNIPITEFSPTEIKVAVTGHGGGGKDGVITMLPKLVTIPKKEAMLDDEYDAIAVGVTALAHRRRP